MAVITVNSGELLLSACNLHSFAISSSLAGPSLRWSMAKELYLYEMHVRTSAAFMSTSTEPLQQRHLQNLIQPLYHSNALLRVLTQNLLQ